MQNDQSQSLLFRVADSVISNHPCHFDRREKSHRLEKTKFIAIASNDNIHYLDHPRCERDVLCDFVILKIAQDNNGNSSQIQKPDKAACHPWMRMTSGFFITITGSTEHLDFWKPSQTQTECKSLSACYAKTGKEHLAGIFFQFPFKAGRILSTSRDRSCSSAPAGSPV